MRTLTAFCALLTPAVLGGRAAIARSAVAEQEPVAQEEDHGPIAEAMETMEDELRVLRKSLRDPAQNESSLKSIVAFQVAVGSAKVAAPPMVAKQPAEKRAELTNAYRKMMIDLSHKLLTLEELVLDGKLEEAQTLFKEIRGMEEDGHERFTSDG